MKSLVILIMLSAACGRINVSNSEHKVSGEATVKVVIGVDTSMCEGLPEPDRQECIKAMIALATEAAKSKALSEAEGQTTSPTTFVGESQ